MHDFQAARLSLRKVPEADKHYVAPFSAPFDPIEIGPSRCGDAPDAQLFVGALGATYEVEALRSANIQTVISITEAHVPHHAGISYHQYHLPDVKETDLLSIWPSVCERVDEGLALGSVLVHCNAGVSRSGSTVAAYVAKRLGLSCQDALDSVRRGRSCIRPNEGFMGQLAKWALSSQLSGSKPSGEVSGSKPSGEVDRPVATVAHDARLSGGRPTEAVLSGGSNRVAYDVEGGHERGQRHSYCFDLADPRWAQHLHDEGYCVLRGVASQEDVEQATALLWRDMEAAHGAMRGRPETWGGYWLSATGIMAHLAQSAGAWYVRGLPGVKAAFERVWARADLLVSMDAVLAWRPWRLEPSWKPRTEGLHIDQNPLLKPQLECVQGMMPLMDVTERSGGLQVVPRSHSEEARVELRGRYAGWGWDWCPLHCDDPMTARAVLLLASAGDLILWDSRTVHGGVVGTDGGDGAQKELARLSVTVAMTPRERASEQVQSLRRAGFAAGESFNHCPHEAGTSSGTIKRRLPRACARVELSEAQRALI